MANPVLRINNVVRKPSFGICDFECPPNCELRVENRCTQYKGSVEGDNPFRKQVAVWRYCPHNRERELARLMHREGITEWR